jgi:hypothetical protein
MEKFALKRSCLATGSEYRTFRIARKRLLTDLRKVG